MDVEAQRKPPQFDMQMRCASCDTLMSQPFEPMPVMDFYKLMTSLTCSGCGGKKLLMGQSRTAAEDDGFERGTTLEERQALWLVNGETGNSAAAIFGRMTGQWESNHHPHDADDLRRCILLLRRIPEWADQMHLMGSLSREWAGISENWAKLTAAFFAEATPELLRRPLPVTVDLLKLIVLNASK